MAAFKLRERRTRRWWMIGLTLAAATAFAVVFVAGSGAVATTATDCEGNASSPDLLAGSNFEIDNASGAGTNKNPYTGGANLVRNHASCLDWQQTKGSAADLFAAGVAKADKQSGTGDDSFAQGTSENDTNPVIKTGSIPPNKSDLQAFGAYKETTAQGKFLDLFWSRTTGPTGTTVMDFELNQKSCSQSYLDTANCYVNSKSDTDAQGHPLAEMPIRTLHDKLISYVFSGSSTPTVCLYDWNGSSWTQPGIQIDSNAPNSTCGTGAQQLTGDALGSINFSGLTAANTFGLGDLSALSFGELSVNFNAIFSGIVGCETFGSAHLSSRSSATFTDELKDFIAPQPVQITNCTTLSTTASNNGSSNSSAQTIGNAISDTATLSVTAPTGTVTFRAYGPFDPNTLVSADQCTSGTLAFTSASGKTLTGPDTNGNYAASDSFIPSSAGRYEWIASFSGDANNSAKAGACGDPGEQSIVSPITPQLVTTASNGTSQTAQSLGGAITDSATLSGTAKQPNGTGAGGNVVFRLYSAAGCDSSKLVFTSSQFAVSGDNTYGPASYTPAAAGTYYWVATYSGNSPNTNGTAGTCGDGGETSIVKPNAPTIVTSATAGPVNLGAPLDDTATLGGTALEPDGVTNAQGTITFKLYGPETSATCADADLKATVTIAVNGNGNYKASNGTLAQGGTLTPGAGTYYWTASYSGDLPNTTAVSEGCGGDSESSVVQKLPTTIGTAQSYYPNDTATITGSGTFDGKVSFELHKNATCTDAAVYSESAVSLNGTGSGSDAHTGNNTYAADAGNSGPFYWKVTYSGDSTHKDVTSCVESSGVTIANGGTTTSP
jgi:hypothetical protein